jgi:hypothetical protein
MKGILLVLCTRLPLLAGQPAELWVQVLRSDLASGSLLLSLRPHLFRLALNNRIKKKMAEVASEVVAPGSPGHSWLQTTLKASCLPPHILLLVHQFLTLTTIQMQA